MNNKIGLQKNTVELQEYNPKWKEIFEKEKRRLIKHFPDFFIEISHGGSTAVPGMSAKPIIDMFAAIEKLSDYKKIMKDLERTGYEYRGEEGVPGRQLFVKVEDNVRTHHLQITTKDNDQWKNHILLREYYVSHPKVMKEYIALKKSLAEKYPQDRISYRKGKNDFVQTILNQAKKV